MKIMLSKSIVVCCAIFMLCTSPYSYAEDLSVEPDVVNLGEPRLQPETQAAQEIHDAIAKTKRDIEELDTNTSKEIDAIHQEINLLETTPGNAAQVKELKEKIKTLKQQNHIEVKRLQKQIKQLEHEARHKFHVRHERF